jgi:hypothetical protein
MKSLSIETQRELVRMLEWLIDLEGPLPGHVEWFHKVEAALAKARAEMGTGNG